MRAREMGMLKLGKIRVDGSKFKANASKHSALSWGHIKKIEQQLRQEIQPLMALAEVSRPKEFHPEPLAEPYVTLSRHTAPVIQPFLLRSAECGHVI